MKDNERKESILKQIFIMTTLGFIDISKKQHFWKEFADDLGGIFKIKNTISYDLQMLSLIIPYKNYQIEFTESDTHPLKINCLLKAKQKLEFFISCEDTIDELMKFFGLQDIEIGNDVFDNAYLIQGPNSKIIKKILLTNCLDTIMLRNNVFSLNCNFQKSDNTLNLSSLVSRTINSKAELSELYKLFCLTIDAMSKLDFV